MNILIYRRNKKKKGVPMAMISIYGALSQLAVLSLASCRNSCFPGNDITIIEDNRSPVAFESYVSPFSRGNGRESCVYTILRGVYESIRCSALKSLFNEHQRPQEDTNSMFFSEQSEEKHIDMEEIGCKVAKLLWCCRNIVPRCIFTKYNESLRESDYVKCFELLGYVLKHGCDKGNALGNCKFGEKPRKVVKIVYFDLNDPCFNGNSEKWIVDIEKHKEGPCDVISLPKSALEFNNHLCMTSLQMDELMIRCLESHCGNGNLCSGYSVEYCKYIEMIEAGRISEEERCIMYIKLKLYSFLCIGSLTSSVAKGCGSNVEIDTVLGGLLNGRCREFILAICTGLGISSK